MNAPGLDGLVRHAEVYGIEFVYETATLYLAERDLVTLRLKLDGIAATSGRRGARRRRRSRRELQVAALDLAERGFTRIAIAEQMGVAVKTIDNVLAPGALSAAGASRAPNTTRSSGGATRGMNAPANGAVFAGETPRSQTR
jgi:hypothetical protein